MFSHKKKKIIRWKKLIDAKSLANITTSFVKFFKILIQQLKIFFFNHPHHKEDLLSRTQAAFFFMEGFQIVANNS